MPSFAHYRNACSLVTMYKAAFPERTPECHLQELLARGPEWFAAWWADASPATRHNFLQDSGLSAGLSLDLTKIKAEAADTARMVQIQGVWADA
jgi:hypothetical protein